MPGNHMGGVKAAQTNRELYGKDFYAKIGSIGGKKGRTGGFYANRELARLAGAKGGTISRRTGVKNGQGKGYIKPSIWQRLKRLYA